MASIDRIYFHLWIKSFIKSKGGNYVMVGPFSSERRMDLKINKGRVKTLAFEIFTLAHIPRRAKREN